jgi:hypothetical protein
MFSITYKPSKLRFRSNSRRVELRSWSESAVNQFIAGPSFNGPAFSLIAAERLILEEA